LKINLKEFDNQELEKLSKELENIEDIDLYLTFSSYKE
jgi:hypothetical protein